MKRMSNPMVLLVLGFADPAGAAPPSAPREATAQAAIATDAQALRIEKRFANLEAVARRWPVLAARAASDLEALGADRDSALLDLRGDSWATLLLSEPIHPGVGVGNFLVWPTGDAAPSDDEIAATAWRGLRDWLIVHHEALRIDPAELPARREDARIAVHEGGALVQMVLPRFLGGAPVRESRLSVTLSHGNLVLFGTENWGRVSAPAPTLEATAARAALAAALGAAGEPTPAAGAEQVLVPLAAEADGAELRPGFGYRYRWAWRLAARLVDTAFPDRQALVDATTGALIWLEGEPEGLAGEAVDSSFDALLDPPLTQGDDPALEDGASTFAPEIGTPAQRAVVGGVFPRSNDGVGSEGTEQAGWPMPFANVHLSDLSVVTTDAGGNLPSCAEGLIGTSLLGPCILIDDECGAIGETSTFPILDLGTSAGSDCAVPAGHSVGDTHAARTAFYALNRFGEAARARLPGNVWLTTSRLALLNESGFGFCNAVYVTAAGNFRYTRSGGGCRNPSEIAAVHQVVFASALDDNDVNGTFANPSYATNYTTAALQSARSCVARGFTSVNCSGFGDPCTACTGAADLDWALHQSGVPHTVAWADTTCGSGDGTPCGGTNHCESQVVGEAIWDLATRDLTAPPFNLSANAALEITTRLFFLASGNVVNWFDCLAAGGCSANGGYLQFLAADDDNGNLSDGTPHMTAIRAAFERHQIHCNVPAAVNSGCADGPAAAPAVIATPRARAAVLRWNAIGGATSYRILRADGVDLCDDGKVPIGETAATSFVATGLREGRA